MDRFTAVTVFVAAVDEGSLAAAGRRFGFSASMAGKYLTDLEAGLNVRLMQRSTRNLSLTDAGRAYYDRCRQILEQFDDANREASDAQQIASGTLRVAAPVTFGTLHVSGVITRFLADHPHVDIDISLDDRYVDLHTSGVDLAIRIGRLPDSQLVARRLAPCRMVLCASPVFIARSGAPKIPDDLQTAPRLAFSDGVSQGEWTFSDRRNRQHVIGGPLRLQANNMEMLVAGALAGMGIAYGPTFAFGQHIKAGTLVQLLPGFKAPELTIHAVFLSARYIPQKVRRFVEYLAEAFGQVPPWDSF
jgi:DNA-binding transcriptional LysR family regulator